MKNNSTNNDWLFHILTIMFIGLKLTGFINWGWLRIIFPSLIPLQLRLFLSIIRDLIKMFRK